MKTIFIALIFVVRTFLRIFLLVFRSVFSSEDLKKFTLKVGECKAYSFGGGIVTVYMEDSSSDGCCVGYKFGSGPKEVIFISNEVDINIPGGLMKYKEPNLLVLHE